MMTKTKKAEPFPKGRKLEAWEIAAALQTVAYEQEISDASVVEAFAVGFADRMNFDDEQTKKFVEHACADYQTGAGDN